jgi:hypothetical protein
VAPEPLLFNFLIPGRDDKPFYGCCLIMCVRVCVCGCARGVVMYLVRVSACAALFVLEPPWPVCLCGPPVVSSVDTPPLAGFPYAVMLPLVSFPVRYVLTNRPTRPHRYRPAHEALQDEEEAEEEGASDRPGACGWR